MFCSATVSFLLLNVIYQVLSISSIMNVCQMENSFSAKSVTLALETTGSQTCKCKINPIVMPPFNMTFKFLNPHISACRHQVTLRRFGAVPYSLPCNSVNETRVLLTGGSIDIEFRYLPTEPGLTHSDLDLLIFFPSDKSAMLNANCFSSLFENEPAPLINALTERTTDSPGQSELPSLERTTLGSTYIIKKDNVPYIVGGVISGVSLIVVTAVVVVVCVLKRKKKTVYDKTVTEPTSTENQHYDSLDNPEHVYSSLSEYSESYLNPIATTKQSEPKVCDKGQSSNRDSGVVTDLDLGNGSNLDNDGYEVALDYLEVT